MRHEKIINNLLLKIYGSTYCLTLALCLLANVTAQGQDSFARAKQVKAGKNTFGSSFIMNKLMSTNQRRLKPTFNTGSGQLIMGLMICGDFMPRQISGLVLITPRSIQTVCAGFGQRRTTWSLDFNAKLCASLSKPPITACRLGVTVYGNAWL